MGKHLALNFGLRISDFGLNSWQAFLFNGGETWVLSSQGSAPEFSSY